METLETIVKNQKAHEEKDDIRFQKGEKQFEKIKDSLDNQDKVLKDIKVSLEKIENVLALPLFASKYPKTAFVIIVTIVLITAPTAAKTIIEFLKSI